MSKKSITITLCAVALLLVCAVVFILVPRANSTLGYEAIKARSDLKAYFGAVIRGDYQKAAVHVAVSESDTQKWMDRIEALAEKNLFLSGIEDLDVRTENGTVKANATLLVNDMGATRRLPAALTLQINGEAGIFGVKYKVVAVTDEEIPLEIEAALSSHLN